MYCLTSVIMSTSKASWRYSNKFVKWIDENFLQRMETHIGILNIAC